MVSRGASEAPSPVGATESDMPWELLGLRNTLLHINLYLLSNQTITSYLIDLEIIYCVLYLKTLINRDLPAKP